MKPNQSNPLISKMIIIFAPPNYFRSKPEIVSFSTILADFNQSELYYLKSPSYFFMFKINPFPVKVRRQHKYSGELIRNGKFLTEWPQKYSYRPSRSFPDSEIPDLSHSPSSRKSNYHISETNFWKKKYSVERLYMTKKHNIMYRERNKISH